MNDRSKIVLLAGLCLLAGSGAFSDPQPPSQAPGKPREATMTQRASGTFDVKMIPQTQDDKSAGPAIGRMSLDKKFHGDLEATSQGEMLAFTTSVQGSAGYVAMEKVSGTLQGKSGTFVLQHSGTMTRGEPQLSITVVPDSGTGQLTGLTGRMTIQIADGKHSYDFEYKLSETP